MYEKRNSDGALIQSLKEDDTAAFELLYDKYWKTLYIKACQRVDQDEAKDIIQEVMISFWNRRHKVEIKEEGDIAKYLYTAVKYRVISHYAFQAKEIKKIDYLEVLSGELNHETVETKELKASIEAAISRLPTRMQQVFRMSREEDLSIADIAKQLNLSEQTVKNQLTEALKRLRSALHANDAGEWAWLLVLLFLPIQ
ncbi:RNA polymerase subunit sigma-24 [Chitinophaga caeni]|uniref:RNA polymerase subunit sigma-24 n=1 Tax=Chitinophaga caeni TaxID=2029983 RepID=A0A291QRS2_9BACT|nr:sigma-70 family RNA polymerase sigma factor [Chitinophaga caeni]ATL46611.1 RNA polymerase subunit sigma-24 [Chitinophaga caeni]